MIDSPNSENLEATLKKIFRKNQDIVERSIEGRIILVPLVSGIGEVSEDLFTLNSVGEFIWNNLDGSTTLDEISKRMCDEFTVELQESQKDLVGFVQELVKRGILLNG